jgi:CHAT domain-containing protein
MMRGALLAGLAALGLACGSKPALPAPDVEYGGCWAVTLPGPVCHLRTLAPEKPGSNLTVWVKSDPGTAVEIRNGGRLVSVAGDAADRGRRFALSLSPRSSVLTIRLRRSDGVQSPPWSLALTPASIPEWYTRLVNLRGGERQKEAFRRLAREAVPANEQGLQFWVLAVQALQEGRDEIAAGFLRRGIAADQRQKDLLGEWKKRGMLAWIEIQQNGFAAARRDLPDLPATAQIPAEPRYQKAFYQGLLATQVGNYRDALEQLQLAEEVAERIGNKTLRWKAEQLLAVRFQSVGRSLEAAERFQRLRADPHPESPCDLGDVLINQAWSWLLAREGGEESSDPIPVLREAQEIYRGCRPNQQLNAGLNLALAYQQARRWREARQTLRELQPLAPEAGLSDRLWWLDMEGRGAIAEGRPAQALAPYDALAATAQKSASLEGDFRAAIGHANARIALGQRAAALSDLAVADGLIDEQAWLIPADAGRDTFLAQKEAATRLYLELLLQTGQQQRAFVMARRSRSRLLRQLTVRDRLSQLSPAEQKRWDDALSNYWALRQAVERQAAQEWQIPADQRQSASEDLAARLAEARRDLDAAMAAFSPPGDRDEGSLSPLRADEVLLLYHPLPQGWVGFAASARGLDVARITLPPGVFSRRRLRVSPADLSRVLLEPFRSTLAQTERVRVLPYGPLRAVDFHALPLLGEPLLSRHTVSYSLDLGSRASAVLPARPTALLVADSEGNLPAARQEADFVGATIRSWGRGWSLRRLDGQAATGAAVRQALPGSDLFHFAGHGSFAGFAGWESALRLSDGSLTLSDLLALRRVPPWIVLSACESGHSSEQAPGEGVGIAQAFLLAGAKGVIAATRNVDDRTARDFIAELYRAWQPGADLASQLQRAQMALRRAHPESDWASFRLLEP